LNTIKTLFMERGAKKSQILGDLFQINRDCTAAYTSMMDQCKANPAVGILLQELVDTESKFLLELRRQVDTFFGDPADKVDIKGEIYKVWQQGIDPVPAKEKDIYVFCEKRLKAVNEAYDKALQLGGELSDNVKRMLNEHLEKMKNTFAGIRKYRSSRTYRYRNYSTT
jgi:hypothetical protein